MKGAILAVFLVVALVVAAPCVTDLTARAKGGKVQLVWTDTGAAVYTVLRGTASGGPYAVIGTTASRYSTYLDETVVNGTTYYYVVDDGGGRSNQASARPLMR